MKKIINSMMALAIAAFTLTACQDVPSPYPMPKPAEPEVITYTGSGTLEDPYTASDAIKYAQSLGGEESPAAVYVKGKVAAVSEQFSTQYGNGTFTISDDGSAANPFTAYRVLYLGNQKFKSSDTPVEVGDEVILYGNIVNFRGNTPETVQGSAYLYSLNGKTAEGSGGEVTPSEPKGDGTLASPFNAAAAITYAESVGDTESDKEVYIAGKVSAIDEQYGTQYGNGSFSISDDGTTATSQFKIWRALYLGNQKFAAGNTEIQVGDDVIVCGKVTNFKGNTPETVQGKAYLYSLNGQTAAGGGQEPTPTPSGDEGSAANPYTISAAIAKAEQAKSYVKGYIVGFVSGQVFSEGATFSSAATVASNILLADSPDETAAKKCIPVQLPSGAIRTALNLQDNPANYKKEVLLYGDITKYFGMPGFKNTSYAVIDDTEVGTKPAETGGDTPAPDAVTVVTVADFIAAPESTSVWYQLTGKVTNLKDGDQYGNFDLVDETGSVYVYGVLSEKGGAKKLFQELVAAKGIKEGSTITIIGNRGSHQGKIEVTNAYFVSVK